MLRSQRSTATQIGPKRDILSPGFAYEEKQIRLASSLEGSVHRNDSQSQIESCSGPCNLSETRVYGRVKEAKVVHMGPSQALLEN